STNSQVRKGGLPPLQRSVMSTTAGCKTPSNVSLKRAEVDNATLERGQATLPHLRIMVGPLAFPTISTAWRYCARCLGARDRSSSRQSGGHTLVGESYPPKGADPNQSDVLILAFFFSQPPALFLIFIPV